MYVCTNDGFRVKTTGSNPKLYNYVCGLMVRVFSASITAQ